MERWEKTMCNHSFVCILISWNQNQNALMLLADFSVKSPKKVIAYKTKFVSKFLSIFVNFFVFFLVLPKTLIKSKL